MSSPDVSIKNYRIEKKIGSGSFGTIYQAINTVTGDHVAVKVEDKDITHPQLIFEAKLLCTVISKSPVVGFPKVHWFGTESNKNIMIMDLLGLSLDDLFTRCHSTPYFSLKTVLMIADQIISRLEYIHSKGFVYRDIKPNNFLIAPTQKNPVHDKDQHIYLIDFGLAKRFQDAKTCKHISHKENKSLTGTPRYASINSHTGEQSRRDDLESLGYMLIYFLKGKLPWQGLIAPNRKDKYELIRQKKISTPIEKLCKDLPNEFSTYLRYIKHLNFEDKPDYQYLRNLFKTLFIRNKYVYDFVYDWSKKNFSTSSSD